MGQSKLDEREVLELAAAITKAYLSRNPIHFSNVPGLIASASASLRQLNGTSGPAGRTKASAATKRKPANGKQPPSGRRR